ncbi:MAG TPA: diacylglycerol kinase family protein [Terriglobia bacterium]|nr:diacylglycerol kinase family protein [Terriglobia bacterium]
MNRRIAAIANPYAARGRAGKLWPRITQQLRARLGEVTFRLTDSTGHATQIARELLQNGFDLIIAVGGDGTVSEVASGFLRGDEPIRRDAQLGILPVGTGSDFQRSLGIPSDVGKAVEILALGKPLTIDVGKATLVGNDGRQQQRYFINLVSFGMGGEVAAGAKNTFTALGGKAGFLWATFKTMASYRGRQVEIEIDDSGPPLPFFITNVAVGNGRYHGGGMHACPKAVLSDGVLEVTVINYLKPFEVVRDIHVLYSENLYRHPKIQHLHARKLAARSEQPTWVEVDGEPLGRLPLTLEVLPQRLPVLLSPASPLFHVAAPGTDVALKAGRGAG